MLLKSSAAAMVPLLAIFTATLVMPIGGAPTPPLRTSYLSSDTWAVKDMLAPTYLIPITEQEPYRPFGPINAASIFKHPEANIDMAMEVAFLVPKDTPPMSYFGLNFSARFRNQKWLQSVKGNNMFAIYAFAAESCSVSPGDTWMNHTAVDRAGGLVYQVIANSSGVSIHGGAFGFANERQALNRLHHTCDGDMFIEFWMEAWGEEFCEFGWIQDRYDGMFLDVLGLA